MNTITSKGIDMPQLELSNFQDKDTNTINLLKYLAEATTIMDTIEDEDAKANFHMTYFIERFRDVPEFREAIFSQYEDIREKVFLCKLKDTFEVGKFYTLAAVKYKLDVLYMGHDVLMEDYKIPKIADLEKNNWFKYERTVLKLNGKSVSGITITECLIEI